MKVAALRLPKILPAVLLALPLAGQEPFLKDWVPQRFLEGDEELSAAVASADGRVLAVHQGAGTIRVFDLIRKQTRRVVPCLGRGEPVLALAEDGNLLLAAWGREVFAYDLRAGGPGQRLFTAAGPVLALALQGGTGAAGSGAGCQGFRLDSGAELFRAGTGPCPALAFLAQGGGLVLLEAHGVALLEAGSGALKWRTPMEPAPLALSAPAGGGLLAAGDAAGTVVLLRTRDGAVERRVSAGAKAQTLALTPDGKGLVVTADRRLVILDALAGAAPRRREIKLEDRISSVVLATAAQSLLVTCRNTRFLEAWGTSLQLPEGLFAEFRQRPAIRIVQPRVTILAPAAGARAEGDAVAILARVKASPDQKVTRVRVLVDGREVEPGAGLKGIALVPGAAPPPGADETDVAFQVPIPDRDCTVTVLAETLYASSPLAAVQLRREGRRPPEPAAVPAGPPPEVAFLEPGAEKTFRGEAAQIRLRVAAAGGPPLRALRFLVDGQTVEALGGPDAPGSQTFTFSVPLPERDCTLAVIAETAGAASRPLSLRLRREPPAAPEAPPAPAQGVVAPTLAILSPASGEPARADSVVVALRLRASAAQKVTALKILVDGQPVALLEDRAEPVPAAPGADLVEEVRQIRVPIPPRPSTITAWAETAYANSELATLKVLREALPVPALAEEPAAPAMVQPEVAILAPASETRLGEGNIALKIRIRYAPDQKPTSLRILLDGVALPVAAAAAPAGPAPGGLLEELREVAIPMPRKDCTVAVVAETALASSLPAAVKIRYQEHRRVDVAALPTLYILAVGVARYHDASLQLTYPAKDARDFAAALQGQKGRLYKEVSAKVLTDAEATRDNIMDGLDWIQHQATRQDVAVIFMAGHGINDPQTGLFYFLPHNADLGAIRRTMVANTDLTSTLETMPGKRILFLDSCNSANVSGKAKTRGAIDLAQVRKDFEAAGQGAVVFAAAAGRQGAQENEAWGNGAFTKAVLEGLGPKGDPRNTGTITVSMLNAYITERVQELTGGLQTPIFRAQDDLADYPLAVLP